MFLQNNDFGFEIYRVRKSAHDIKSQTGAYRYLENAIKRAVETCCNVYDNTLKCVYEYNLMEVDFKMNSPYNGKFKVTQLFNPTTHDGLDLVGIDSKEIHSTINGVVEKAGWENALNKKQGFGLYVRIKKDGSEDKYYFGHLSELKVKKGQRVAIGDVLGIEGNTGNSTGAHCHYCVRGNGSKKFVRDICIISGIPNRLEIFDDGYLAKQMSEKKTVEDVVKEVIAGLWGNGEERKQKLTAAGYDYSAIQSRVNEVVSGASLKSNEEIAREVIAGLWGNGEERREKLLAAGYDPSVIQQIVNKKILEG